MESADLHEALERLQIVLAEHKASQDRGVEHDASRGREYTWMGGYNQGCADTLGRVIAMVADVFVPLDDR